MSLPVRLLVQVNDFLNLGVSETNVQSLNTYERKENVFRHDDVKGHLNHVLFVTWSWSNVLPVCDCNNKYNRHHLHLYFTVSKTYLKVLNNWVLVR